MAWGALPEADHADIPEPVAEQRIREIVREELNVLAAKLLTGRTEDADA